MTRSKALLILIILTVLVSGCISILDQTDPQDMKSLLDQNSRSIYTVNYSFQHKPEGDFLANHTLTKYNREGDVMVEHTTEYVDFFGTLGGTSIERLYDPGNTSIKCEVEDGKEVQCRESPGSLQGDFLLNSEELNRYVRNSTYKGKREILGRTCSLFQIELYKNASDRLDGSDPSTDMCIDREKGYIAYTRTNATITGERQLSVKFKAEEVTSSIPDKVSVTRD